MNTSKTAVTRQQATAVLNEVAAWLGHNGYGSYDDCSCLPPMRPGDDGREHRPGDPKCAVCGGRGYLIGPAPTGRHAADHGLGPVLVMDWDWNGKPTPTVILEGGPYDWAIECCFDVQQALKASGVPLFVEPYSGWALSVYPA